MDIKTFNADYAVCSQISVTQMQDIAARGLTTIICNRPDTENAAGQQSADLRAKAAELGLQFHYNPVIVGQLSEDNITLQASVLAETQGKTLAFCRTGMRSAIVWGLSRAGLDSADDILATAARAGFGLDNLRPYLEQSAVA